MGIIADFFQETNKLQILENWNSKKEYIGHYSFFQAIEFAFPLRNI